MKKGVVVLGAFLAFVMIKCEGNKPEVEGIVEPELEAVVVEQEVVDHHTSEDALDWAGTYYGSRPCADCEAVETKLTLSQDKAFTLVEKYKGKSEEEVIRTGKFSFDSTGMHVMMDAEGMPRLKVGENTLIFLDQEGQQVKGDLAERYTLHKAGVSLTQTEWKLVEIKGQPVTDSLTNLVPTLFLDTLNQRVSGNASCNQYSGSFTTNNMFFLHFNEMIATKKGCLGANIEQLFLSTLSKVDNYIITGNTLSLNKGKMATLMRFVPVEK
ncbi:META domain-containing protein [Lishizhenia tianjinensis]|uniref:META domain-containing protein n=1 Tax=Lishizhenia tianjinensis TaxID=477690 RepID=A0A1I6YSW3_9FLAO|nr:copper resistance protein NlpE N-terminal domain-containing protein [Lishizhenia tianjinensis]SFT53540.1 META domain-containing protein [Lishizhenia tianjinensis]